MFAEAGFSEQPDFFFPLLGVGLLCVLTGVAIYLALQLVVEMLSGGCDYSIRNLLKLTAYIAIASALFGVFLRLYK